MVEYIPVPELVPACEGVSVKEGESFAGCYRWRCECSDGPTQTPILKKNRNVCWFENTKSIHTNGALTFCSV